jgi:hypothetical protein
VKQNCINWVEINLQGQEGAVRAWHEHNQLCCIFYILEIKNVGFPRHYCKESLPCLLAQRRCICKAGISGARACSKHAFQCCLEMIKVLNVKLVQQQQKNDKKYKCKQTCTWGTRR